MKKICLFLMLIFSSFSFGQTQIQLKELMHNYLLSIKTSNEKNLKKIVSDYYYKILKKDGQLEQLFALQKNDGKKIDFDLKFQKYGKKQNEYLVNIKDKSKLEFDHYWYVVILRDKKLIIDREIHLY